MSDDEPEVNLGERVENEGRPRSVLLAVRFPVDLAARVSEYAQAHGMSVSEAIRQGAEHLTSAMASQSTADGSNWETSELAGSDASFTEADYTRVA